VKERWGQYIRKGIEEEGGIFRAAFQSWQYAASLVETIRRAVPPPARILGGRCGAAFLSNYLHHSRYRVTAVDEDPEVLEIAREIATSFHARPVFALGRAADLAPHHRQFDLNFSEVAVEHFPRETTVDVLHGQSRCSPWVVVSVPTGHTQWIQGATDDNDFYSLRGLKKMVREAGLRVMDSGAFCDVQSSLSIWLSRLLPLHLYCGTQHAFTLSVSAYCLGRRSHECG